MDIVKMEHVTKIYGSGDTRVWALDDVNLTVQKEKVWQWSERLAPASPHCYMSWAASTRLRMEK